jgi:hypothetical protein
MNQKKNDFSFDLSKIKNIPHRHKRLYNMIAIPIQIDEDFVICEIGNSLKEKIPKGYFERDWKIDLAIDYNELKSEMIKFGDNVYYTIFYNLKIDNFDDLYLIYFDLEEKDCMYPEWKLKKFNKEERNSLNPFSIIMPVNEEKVDEIEKELPIMNLIRKENENVEFDENMGFEFALIKLLEKKYLKDI